MLGANSSVFKKVQGDVENHKKTPSIFDVRDPAWLRKQEYDKLYKQVEGVELCDQLAMRNQKEFLVNPESSSQTQDYNNQSHRIKQRLRRGKFAGQRYYRTQRERLEAEANLEKYGYKTSVDFEKSLKDYPRKFNVVNCQTIDRTFPACMSDVKAPTELESFQSIALNKINPKTITHNPGVLIQKPTTKSQVSVR